MAYKSQSNMRDREQREEREIKRERERKIAPTQTERRIIVRVSVLHREERECVCV